MITRPVYTRFSKFCTSVFALLLIGTFSLGMPIHTAYAESDTCPSASYYIQNIDSAAVADTSEEARAEATLKSLLAAWARLESRLLISGQNVPEVTKAEDVLPLLDYTRLVNETVLPSRYQAVFDYCFDRLKIRDYFAEHGLRHAELRSGSILVLPIWMTPDGPHLWRTPNPWAESWVRILAHHDGLLDLRLPSSLATERAIEVQPLMARNPETLAKAAQLEKTERLLLMVMSPRQQDDSIVVDVRADLFDKSGKFDAEAYRMDGAALNTDTMLADIDDIALTLLSGIEDVWRNTNVVNVQDSGVLVLAVKARSLKEWRSSLDILASLSPVEQVSVVKLGLNGGLVQLKLGGSITSLNYALEAHGLTLEEDPEKQQSYLSLARIVN